MVGWLRRWLRWPTPAPGSRRAARARAVAYLQQQGMAGPGWRDALPGVALVLALLALPLLGVYLLVVALGVGGLLVVLAVLGALAAAVVRRRAVVARRRAGRYTEAELQQLADPHAVARATARMLRRDGWRVRSIPWQGTPRLMARDQHGRLLEVTVRPVDSAGDATPAPAPLRRVGTTVNGGVLRLVVSLGRYSRQDVLWASRQGGVFLLDGQQLAAWGAGTTLSHLLGPFPLPDAEASDVG
ncbi:hypothetical protein ACFV1W_30355 [Kitasatospora sp. NPDC059648]|uniref:hypothetical protein n=1 Tax=Kitasatospora sp. NPDC059648 TaxID=3346894 RepID=UPI0036AADE41